MLHYTDIESAAFAVMQKAAIHIPPDYKRAVTALGCSLMSAMVVPELSQTGDPRDNAGKF